MRRQKRVFYLARASLLAILMLWFSTHHLAPGFESRVLQLGLHTHASSDETPQWSAAHAHPKHCDFCGSSTFAVLTLENSLPRASQLILHNLNLEFQIVARVPLTRLARAPPALI